MIYEFKFESLPSMLHLALSRSSMQLFKLKVRLLESVRVCIMESLLGSLYYGVCKLWSVASSVKKLY